MAPQSGAIRPTETRQCTESFRGLQSAAAPAGAVRDGEEDGLSLPRQKSLCYKHLLPAILDSLARLNAPMAKRKKTQGVDIDWYLVSIDRLKKIGFALLVLVLVAAGWFYYVSHSQSPMQRAESRIADAEKALNDLAASPEFASFRTEFNRGNTKLKEARKLLGQSKYPEAESAAVESQTIVKAALARLPGQTDSDAQFLSVEGNVLYQKAASSEWNRADTRTPLLNGDWVKTAAGASAELIFSNGTLYTVGAEALLEIHTTLNPATSKKENSVKMTVGSVEINTADDTSKVGTPGTEVLVSAKSAAQVGVDTVENTRVVSIAGTASVIPKEGAPVQIASGEQVRASKQGSLSTVSKLAPAPTLTTPIDNEIFQGSTDSTVALSWNPQPGAVAYQLQVSRSRLFSAMEINARRTTTRATTKVSSEGAFYWRVASVDVQGEVGPFSPFRRFRVTGLGSLAQASEADKTPPTLQVNRPLNIGGQYYMVEGKAEPGASVFINDEEIQMQSDGSFKKLVSFTKVGWNAIVIKAVDPAGNQTVQSEKVHVEE